MGSNTLSEIKVVEHFSTPQTKQHSDQHHKNKPPIIEIYIVCTQEFTESYFNFFLKTIIFGDQRNNPPRGIVHICYRRVGVQADGMELVAVLHCEFSKCLEILVVYGCLHLSHPSWYHMLSSILTTEIHKLTTAIILLCN